MNKEQLDYTLNQWQFLEIENDDEVGRFIKKIQIEAVKVFLEHTKLRVEKIEGKDSFEVYLEDDDMYDYKSKVIEAE